MNLRKHSNQVELDQFFKTLHGQTHATQHVTKSALSQARRHLSDTAFVELNHQLIEEMYASSATKLKRWKGHRLCAIDGSSVRLPNTDEMVESFGEHGGRFEQCRCALAMTSVFYDVLNRVAIDACLERHRTSEYVCAATHLTHARRRDLVIYDRGYNAFWLYAFHRAKGISFCIRAKTEQNLAVKRFVDSGASEAVVTFTPTTHSIKECAKRDIDSAPMRLRLVRVDLADEVEVLITNLMNADDYPADQFAWLYHQRWAIEENFKRLKQWTQIENFSGKSALSVRQDFHAKILATNLTELMSWAAQKMVDKKGKERRQARQINFSQALSKMKHVIVELIYHAKTTFLDLLVIDRVRYISLTTEALRPGRSAPRRARNIKNKIHYPAYKCAL